MPEISQPLKILHIAGAQRSGSTILEKIMGEIDGIVSLGEVRFVWERGFYNNQMCGCGQHFHDCEFWQKVKRHSFPKATDLDLKAVLKIVASVSRIRHLPIYFLKPLFPRFHAMVDSYAQHILKIYRGASATHKAKVLIDSSQHIHGQVLVGLPGINLYVLHLVRDGRAIAYSWTRKKVYEEDHGELTYLPRYHSLTGASGWFFENLSAELLRRRCGHYMRIRYEDFVREPREIFKRIFAFIDEPDLPMPVSEDFKVDLTVQHLVSGNPVRFKQGETTIKADTQWKTAMPRATQIGLTCLLWPLLLRYGYLSRDESCQ